MRTTSALLIVVVLLMPVGSALADGPECQPKIQAGDAGIYFDATGSSFVSYQAPFVPFKAYVLGFDLPGGLLGYELAVTGFEGLFLLAVQFLGIANQGDIPGEFIVTTGECVAGTGVVQLVEVTLMASGTTGPDHLLCLTGTDPTSFDGYNGAPGFLQCDGGLRPFTPSVNCEPLVPAGCSFLNPTFDLWACPIEDASFGTLKAAF